MCRSVGGVDTVEEMEEEGIFINPRVVEYVRNCHLR